MWRNGRRNGLKIRSREKRGMGSNPIIGTSENAFYDGKFVETPVQPIPHVRASKRTDYPSICQVLPSALEIATTGHDVSLLRWKSCQRPCFVN
jgi:hypothetical protein